MLVAGDTGCREVSSSGESLSAVQARQEEARRKRRKKKRSSGSSLVSSCFQGNYYYNPSFLTEREQDVHFTAESGSGKCRRAFLNPHFFLQFITLAISCASDCKQTVESCVALSRTLYFFLTIELISTRDAKLI